MRGAFTYYALPKTALEGRRDSRRAKTHDAWAPAPQRQPSRFDAIPSSAFSATLKYDIRRPSSDRTAPRRYVRSSPNLPATGDALASRRRSPCAIKKIARQAKLSAIRGDRGQTWSRVSNIAHAVEPAAPIGRNDRVWVEAAPRTYPISGRRRHPLGVQFTSNFPRNPGLPHLVAKPERQGARRGARRDRGCEGRNFPVREERRGIRVRRGGCSREKVLSRGASFSHSWEKVSCEA